MFSLAFSAVLCAVVCIRWCIVFLSGRHSCSPCWCWTLVCFLLQMSACVFVRNRLFLVFCFSFQRYFFRFFCLFVVFRVREFAVRFVNSSPFRVLSTGFLVLALGSYPIADSQVCPFLEGGPNGRGQTWEYGLVFCRPIWDYNQLDVNNNNAWCQQY